MRRFSLFALFALVLGCLCCAPAALPPPVFSPVDLEMGATVALFGANDIGQVRAYCAGVWVGPSEILTAAHCTAPEMAVRGDTFVYGVRDETIDGSIPRDAPSLHRAVLLRRDEARDLAVLVTSGAAPAHTIAVLSSGLRTGDRVDIIGHPLGLLYSWSPGWVESLQTMDGPADIHGEFIVVWSGAGNGNSGGGVWDSSGRLAGIASFKAERAPIAFFVATETIRSFLLGD